MNARKKNSTPVHGKQLLLADLDGVIYRGTKTMPGAATTINHAAKTMLIAYITNNASRTVKEVAETLHKHGLQATPQQIVTSAQAAAKLLQQKTPPGTNILVVGGTGLREEITKAGYKPVTSSAENPAAVVQGFAPEIGWQHLAQASLALTRHETSSTQNEIPWIATNTDWTLPLENGLAPGNGTLVSAIHTAVQRLPEFAGKPETPIFEEAFTRYKTKNALMVGDRLDTDITGANKCAIESALVLTGVDRPKQLIAAPAGSRPTYIIPTIENIFTPYPATRIRGDGSVQVGNARVTMRGHIAEILREGDNPLNLLRAGCQAVWRSGLAIYGLKIPEKIYEDHWA